MLRENFKNKHLCAETWENMYVNLYLLQKILTFLFRP